MKLFHCSLIKTKDILSDIKWLKAEYIDNSKISCSNIELLQNDFVLNKLKVSCLVKLHKFLLMKYIVNLKNA